MTERISRDLAMMKTAEVWAQRSTCFRRNVGAVISVHGHVVSTGYNGAAPGEPHCLGAKCTKPGEGCTRAVHAEINAIKYMPSQYLTMHKHMYVTESPCPFCAEVIVDHNYFTKVFYLNEYRIPEGIDILLNGGVKVYRMTPSGYIIDRATGELVEVT